MQLKPPQRKEWVLKKLLGNPGLTYSPGDDNANRRELEHWPIVTTLDNPQLSRLALLTMIAAQVRVRAPLLCHALWASHAPAPVRIGYSSPRSRNLGSG